MWLKFITVMFILAVVLFCSLLASLELEKRHAGHLEIKIRARIAQIEDERRRLDAFGVESPIWSTDEVLTKGLSELQWVLKELKK